MKYWRKNVWSKDPPREVESPEINAFLDEIAEVCRRHRMTISHEDGHGSFIIEDLYEPNIAQMRFATDGRHDPGCPCGDCTKAEAGA